MRRRATRTPSWYWPPRPVLLLGCPVLGDLLTEALDIWDQQFFDDAAECSSTPGTATSPTSTATAESMAICTRSKPCWPLRM